MKKMLDDLEGYKTKYETYKKLSENLTGQIDSWKKKYELQLNMTFDLQRAFNDLYAGSMKAVESKSIFWPLFGGFLLGSVVTLGLSFAYRY